MIYVSQIRLELIKKNVQENEVKSLWERISLK